MGRVSPVEEKVYEVISVRNVGTSRAVFFHNGRNQKEVVGW